VTAGWQGFSRPGRHGGDPVPRATFRPEGALFLNAAAHRLIGRTSALTLLYDPEQRVLALRPAAESDEAAYRSSTGMVSVRALFSYYRLLHPEAPTSVDVELQDGMLVVPLPGEVRREDGR